MTALEALIARFDQRERWPGCVEYRLGEEDRFRVAVFPTMVGSNDARWHVLLGHATLQPPVRDLEKALTIALYVYEAMQPEVDFEKDRLEAWFLADEARRAAEEPARDAAARKRAARLKKAPLVAAARCPECGQVDSPEEFEERGYECSNDGSTGRGDDGRRCDQCNRFRARVADYSCPSCEQPLPDGPEDVAARHLDGEFVSEESEA